jgi:hypothetical protein
MTTIAGPDHAAEIILPLFRFAEVRIVRIPVKPVVGVQRVIPEVFKELP